MANHTMVEFTEEQMQEYLQDPKNVLQIFMSSFVEKYGYNHNNVRAEIADNKGTYTMWKGKPWSLEQKNTALIGLEHKTFRIVFGEGTTDCIEVYKIEAKMQNRGIGTRVMEQVLDLADELGVNVTLIPTPYKNVDDEKYCSFLRQWYYDLGFDHSPLSPIMTYKHKQS